MTYRAEFLNDQGDWVLKSWHKNESNAETVCEVVAQSGYVARIIKEGRIIKYFDKK